MNATGELEALLSEPAVAELPAARRALLGAHDTLTAHPTEDDTVLYAVPICAPYSVLVPYRYRIKLISPAGDTLSTDPSGNDQWSRDLKLRTSALGDTLPPVIVEGPVVVVHDVLAVVRHR